MRSICPDTDARLRPVLPVNPVSTEGACVSMEMCHEMCHEIMHPHVGLNPKAQPLSPRTTTSRAYVALIWGKRKLS